MPSLRTALVLGRVSNVPTVWTNVLAGLALAGVSPNARLFLPLALATSLLYVGGMYLNDAFDHRWDAQHRPERPIPSRDVSARTVFIAGFAMLAAGPTLLALTLGVWPALAAGALAVLILVYDVSHKKNPIAPLVMGLCRVGVYTTSAVSVAVPPSAAVWTGSAVLLAYLITLTIIARREAAHPRLRGVVGPMIAGISLLDGAVLLLHRHWLPAAACVLAFLLTRRWQRHVPGT